MKRKVYQSAEDKYIEMEVLARYEYIGNDGGISLTKGVVYDCVGYEKDKIRLVDDTKEDFLFLTDNFRLVEDFRK